MFGSVKQCLGQLKMFGASLGLNLLILCVFSLWLGRLRNDWGSSTMCWAVKQYVGQLTNVWGG